MEGNAELEKLNREITLELDRIHEGARNDFDVANKQVANVEALLDDMRRQAAERERRSLSLFELEREVKAISAIYSNFLTRLKEMEAQEDIQTADARIVSYAAVPLVPSKPRKTLVMSRCWLNDGMGISELLVLSE